MRGSIRMASFKWDPEHESRASIANRIKRYVQDELNRIEDELKHRRWLARRRASPTYERDRSIWEDHELHGVEVAELARHHGLTRQYVREVLRVERHRRQREDQHCPPDEPNDQAHPARELPALPFGFEKTSTRPFDP